MTARFETIRVASTGGLATLTLDRPESRNALNSAMCAELTSALTALAADGTKLVLLRAAGAIFCAGADLKERKGMSEDQIRARRLKAFRAYHTIEHMPMPVVAVVEGPAVGSGCEIAAAADFIVATPAASFRTPEVIWGTVGATQRLPRVLGKRLAKDLMFTGRTLSVDEAYRHGFVTRLVEPAELEATLTEIADTILNVPDHALRLAKRCIDTSIELDGRGALAVELMAIEENLARQEWREGIAAFADRPV